MRGLWSGPEAQLYWLSSLRRERRSYKQELRAESHKQGRSLESGILFREKDDDLALFNEMQPMVLMKEPRKK